MNLKYMKVSLFEISYQISFLSQSSISLDVPVCIFVLAFIMYFYFSEISFTAETVVLYIVYLL